MKPYQKCQQHFNTTTDLKKKKVMLNCIVLFIDLFPQQFIHSFSIKIEYYISIHKIIVLEQRFLCICFKALY